MAEFVMKDIVAKRGLSSSFHIASSATSTEEIWNGIGNPVYPPAKKELAKHGISCEGKRAVQLTKADYEKYDYLIGMEGINIRYMNKITGGDPWYTGDFGATWWDVSAGCEGLLEYLLAVECDKL